MKKESKKSRIWGMLLRGMRITPHDVLPWCMSLSQRIGDLKKEKSMWLSARGLHIKADQPERDGHSTYWIEAIVSK